MQKDDNRQASFNKNNTHYSQETLQEMNDDRLNTLKSMLKGQIIKLQKASSGNVDNSKLQHLQVEHSYVSRELEIRENRKKIHEEYLKKQRAARPGRRYREKNPRQR